MKMKSPSSRPYRMKARAEAAAQTGRNVLAATVALWREKSLDEITLQEIAGRAGVSVQTVIRRFGSKEGVFEACIESDVAGVRVERDRTPAGDVDGALETLLAHYERDGDAVLRTLALEDKLDAARAITARGRLEHRAWCTRVFGPFLPPRGVEDVDEDSVEGCDGDVDEEFDKDVDEEFDRRVDAFVAATDVYVWKLLRRDLGLSAEETKRTIRMLVDGLIGRP